MPVSAHRYAVRLVIRQAERVQFLVGIIGILVGFKPVQHAFRLVGRVGFGRFGAQDVQRDEHAVDRRCEADPCGPRDGRGQVGVHIHDVDAHGGIRTDHAHILAAGFVRAVLSAFVAVAQDLHHCLQGDLVIRCESQRILIFLVIVTVTGGSQQLMPDPGAHVAVVLHGPGAGIGQQQVQFTVVAVNREAVVGRQLLQVFGYDAVFVIREVFQVELVAEGAHLVVRQPDRGILVSCVHLDVPGFLLIDDQGDVRFRAAKLIDQARQVLHRFLRGPADGDHHLVHRVLRDAGGHPRIRGHGGLVAECRHGHGHRHAVLIDADRVVHFQPDQPPRGIHPGRSRIFECRRRHVGKRIVRVVHRHPAVRDLFHPGHDRHAGRADPLRIVGAADDDVPVGGHFPADIDACTGGCARRQQAEQDTDHDTEELLHMRGLLMHCFLCFYLICMM